MITIYTRSAAHLAPAIQLSRAPYAVTQFSDGELHIEIEPDIARHEIWIITSTQAPAENILELFFLLDALTKAGAQKINILFTYFAYARQASSAEFICNVLKKFSLNKIIIVHAHASQQLHAALNFTDALAMDFFCNVAQGYDIVAAPDQGAAEFAKKVAHISNKDIILLHKSRPEHDQVKIESIDGIVKNKRVLLIDDIISTGRTLDEAARALKNLGAQEIGAAATHGIFSPGAHERLTASDIKKIYVTNSLDQAHDSVEQIYNIGPLIQKIIQKG